MSDFRFKPSKDLGLFWIPEILTVDQHQFWKEEGYQKARRPEEVPVEAERQGGYFLRKRPPEDSFYFYDGDHWWKSPDGPAGYKEWPTWAHLRAPTPKEWKALVALSKLNRSALSEHGKLLLKAFRHRHKAREVSRRSRWNTVSSFEDNDYNCSRDLDRQLQEASPV